ncbi:anti-sigma factor antagonist [Bacillus pumilus]|nr:anti-sigma factor antagonist [Bacillus pumilus]
MNMSVKEHQIDHKTKISVSGEIDVYSAPELRETLMPKAEQGEHLEICLKDVSYMDSTGLGVFVGLFKAAQKAGGTLKLENLSDRLVRLFEITGLKDIIDISAKSEGGVQ